MAATKVQHLRKGRSGTKTNKGRSYIEEYRVLLDSHTDMIRLALIADDGETAVPDIYDSYPTDTNVRCLNKDAVQVGDESVVIVTARYETPKNKERESPFDDPPQVHWGFASHSVVVEKDVVTNKPIVSSADEVLVPGLEEDDYNLTLEVVQNENTFDEVNAATYVGKCNSDTFNIDGTNWSAGVVKCTDYSAQYLERNGTDYWAVTLAFEFQSGGWDRDIIDQGTYYKDGSGNKHLFKDAGEKSPVVKNLNGSGGALADDTAAEFLTYTTKTERTFSPLDLGSLT